MNARSISRAAERQAQKQALNDAKKNQANTSASRISEAQLTANRANAQLSTGSRSETGKRVSSLNAVKTGLTGRTVLLPSDDAVAYQQLVESFFRDHQPKTGREYEAVQSLADTQWRLQRIPALEMAIFARGRVQFAEQFAEYDPHVAAQLVDAETAIVYERQLRNLWIQEKRLHRQYADVALELQRLKRERLCQREEPQPVPAKVAKPQILPGNGFEFLKKLEESGKRINNLPLEEMEKEIDSLDALGSLLPEKNQAA
jgi:hypothetical protein